MLWLLKSFFFPFLWNIGHLLFSPWLQVQNSWNVTLICPTYIFFSNTDVNGQVLMHCFLISKENIVLWKIWCLAQNRKFCFVFSFKLFFNSNKSISSWSICRQVLCYFSISNFSPLKHLNDSFPLTKAIQSTSGTLAKYLPWSKNRFSPQKTISIILFPLLLGLEPCLGGGLCPYRGACMQHCTFSRTVWNEQTERRDFYLVGWAKFQVDKEPALEQIRGKKSNWWRPAKNVVTPACRRRRGNLSGELRWTHWWLWEPQRENEDPAGHCMGSEVVWAWEQTGWQPRQDSNPRDARTYPHTAKAAATWVNKRTCGMRGRQNSSWHRCHAHLWDLLLELYGQPPSYHSSLCPCLLYLWSLATVGWWWLWR